MKLVDSRAHNTVHAILLCAFAGALVSLSPPSKAASSTLTISNTPRSTVTVGGPIYYFAANVTNTANTRVHFCIYNKPAFLHWNSVGNLWGKAHPEDVGTYRNIRIMAWNAYGSVTTRPFSITVVASSSALTLVGHAPTAVNVGTAYTFSPTASDPNQAKLAFSIKNKPSWATFNMVSGALSGTPRATDAGSYANIQISVTDGKSTVALPAFTIAVNQLSASNAVLDWTPPTENNDGSVLTNLAGFKVHYGTSPTQLAQVIDLPNPGLTSYVVENLRAGKWYFAVTSYAASGEESSLSGVVGASIL